MKGRIALFLPSLRGGGAERVMVTLANGFGARGLAVDLVLAKAEGPYLKDVSEAVRVVDLGASRVLASLPGLIRYLRRERPAAMLSAMNHANVVALLARKLARIPTRLVVSEHNTLSAGCDTLPLGRARMMPWLMRRTYPWATSIVAVSTGVADDLARAIHLSRERISVVFNPVATDMLIRRNNDAACHPWLTPGEPPVILAVGRLTPQKDFTTLIHAFARLRASRSVRLIILGEGEMRAELEALLGKMGLLKDVAMPGFVDNPFDWMHASRMFVLSSAWEGLGMVLIEAMACGTPVVSTDCPSGPAEILENGKWGRLVPPGDADALYVAIKATLDDSNGPDVARRARDFGVDQAVDGYLKAFDANSTGRVSG